MMGEKKGSLPMLQNNNKKQVELLYTSDTKYRTGMTLIELVVAMAILSIILTGLVTMFVSAIESTHQGYMVKESYGNARSAMEILSRDLERACTLANRGEKVQFYGTPTALTFVTMLDNGQVGRVTYFFAPSPSIPVFETWLPIGPKDNLPDRISKEKGMKREANKIPNESAVYFFDDILPKIQAGLPAGCDVTTIVNNLDSLLTTGDPFPEVQSEANVIGQLSSEEQAYRVRVQPMALFRIEETTKANIIDIELKKGFIDSSGTAIQSMPDPDLSTVENPFSYTGYSTIDALLHAFIIEGTGTQSGVSMVSPVETQTPSVNVVKDLRNYINNPNYQTIDTNFVNDLITIRKAELRLLLMQVYNSRQFCNEWFNLLRNPTNVLAITGQGGILNLSPYIWSYDLSIARRDQMYLYQLLTGGTGNPYPNTEVLYNFWETNGQNPLDYVLADGFGAHAYWIDEINGLITSTDMLFPGNIFSYQSEENQTVMYFNDIRSIPLFSHYLSLPPESLTVPQAECLTAFLDRVWTEMKGTDPSQTSPFATVFFERLPVRITVSAWVCTEKPQPGVSDFRRWFSQSIDIPCGLRTPQPRRMPAGM
ncbi:MAG: PilW family protein [Candidatus Hydrogenedens sp.]